MLYGKQNDAYNLVYIAHFLLGTCILLLYKTFITPYDYFTDIYPEFNFEFWFASLFWTPTLPALFLVLKYGKKHTQSSRIIISLLVITIGLIAVPIATRFLLKESHHKAVALWIFVGDIIIGGFFSGVFLASCFALASRFPPKYTQALLSGNAFAGCVMIAIRIAIKYAFGTSSTTSVDLYFWCASMISVFALILFIEIRKMPYAVYHFRQMKQYASIPEEPETEASPLLADPETSAPTEALTPSFETPQSFPTLSEVKISVIMKKIWPYVAMTTISFFTTSALWPGLITAIQPLHKESIHSWFQLILIACFNGGDLVGRFLSDPVAKYVPDRPLWIATLLRVIVFFPMVIIQVDPLRIPSNFAGYLLAFMLPMTGGALGGCCIIRAPSKVLTQEREITAMIMTGAMTVGIFLGSNLALVLMWVTMKSVWNIQ